jgi:CDP-diacylglycerol--glycerol-3-phosphate 3-phosphatidyltransferase
MNLPNKLTVLRIIMIPIFVALYYISVIPYHFILSAVIFALAAFTDFLDGYIARKYNIVTDLGKFLDPIADKVLVSSALIVMLVPIDGILIIPSYGAIAVAIILARELVVSGFRMVAASKGMVIAADKSGKIKTFVTDIAIVVLLVGADISLKGYMNLGGLILLGIATVLTIISGIECIVKNKAVLKG